MQEYTLSDGTTVIEPGSGVEAEKTSCRVIQAGTLVDGADVVVNFDNGGIFTCTVDDDGVNEFDVSSLNIGQVGRMVILSGDGAATVTWVGVDIWAGEAEPVFGVDEATFVTLFNDGDQVIGNFRTEGSAAFVADLPEDIAKTDVDDAGTIDGTEIAALFNTLTAAINANKAALVTAGLMASS